MLGNKHAKSDAEARRARYIVGMTQLPDTITTQPADLNATSDGERPGQQTRLADRVDEAFEVIGGELSSGLILVCDHATNRFPDGYDRLGLPGAQLERHIAYDIGAAVVTRAIAAKLGAPAVLSRFSRLFIDPNRGADDPTLIMQLSDGAVVPGNRTLDAAERQHRIAHYHAPYHGAIDSVIDASLAAGITPTVLSIHSFTEQWKGTPRPWHVTVLWDRDDRLPAPLLQAFAADPALIVGDNVPYTGELKGDCMYQHATMRGLAHALIEVRQDLIRAPEGQAAWGDRIAGIMQMLWSDAAMRERLSVQLARPTPPNPGAAA